MPLAAGSRFGHFEIVAPLGAGGMGEVYRARDVRLGREVALKVLPQELSQDRDRLSRSEQEARSASALNHPNIVAIHDSPHRGREKPSRIPDRKGDRGDDRPSPRAPFLAARGLDRLLRVVPGGQRDLSLRRGPLGEGEEDALERVEDIAGVPCWRPDGGEIWIAAHETGQTDALYAIDLTGRRRLVTRVPGYLELDDISRDGRVLVAHHTMVRILAGLASGQEKERDLSWIDSSVPADLSPDGKTLIFSETG